MRIKLLALLSLSVASLVFTGCDGGTAQMGPKETNVLGIVKVQEENYSHTGPNTFAVSTDELYDRQNYDGHKVSLLWGLVTIKDY
jgi:hypothetical protein